MEGGDVSLKFLLAGTALKYAFPQPATSLMRTRGRSPLRHKAFSIPFHALSFEDGGSKLYVFYCLWVQRSKSSDWPLTGDEWSRLARLRSVLLGERKLGQQTLEIVVSGYDTPEKAEIAFRREMVNLIQTGTKDLVADASNR